MRSKTVLFTLMALTMVALTLSGCLGLNAGKDKAAIAKQMEGYFAEDFQHLQKAYSEETDEEFVEDFRKLLSYYGDTFTLGTRIDYEARDVELTPIVPQDMSHHLASSSKFSKASLLAYDPLHYPSFQSFLATIFSESDVMVFFPWLNDQGKQSEQNRLSALRSLVPAGGNPIVTEPVKHTPVIEVNGKSATYTLTYTIDWKSEFLGTRPNTLKGNAYLTIRWSLEKNTEWTIVGYELLSANSFEQARGLDLTQLRAI
jgi:hypothetical protein